MRGSLKTAFRENARYYRKRGGEARLALARAAGRAAPASWAKPKKAGPESFS
jgi:hypothetical protein